MDFSVQEALGIIVALTTMVIVMVAFIHFGLFNAIAQFIEGVI